MVKSYTAQQLIARVETLPTFKGWIDGIYDIWVRSNEDLFNVFDDKVYTFEVKNGVPIFVMVCSGTTNAGAQGLMRFSEYNPNGCAVLCADTLVYNSHGIGLHKGQYPAYVQSFEGGFPYTRDNDRDRKSENYGTVYTNRIGANCHRASSRMAVTSEIGGWSVACLVRNQLSQWNRWMKFMESKGNPNLNVCILTEF
jgi:hypothetical protein